MNNIWLPYSQMYNVRKPPEATSAKGSRIYLKNNQSIIDAISSWWVITLGHCHPNIVKAVQKQAAKMDQILFANFSHTPARSLAKEIKTLLPKKLQYLFFSDNGSTAVEAALKMALQSFKQKEKHTKRTHFLSFTHSYHGDTAGAMSVSGRSLFTKPYKEMLFPVIRAKQGRYLSDPISTWLADFESKLKTYHKSLAGVIIEPLIQGAGGMIVWPKEVLQEICHLTKKKGLYLIFDEIMTGFGRTGELFAFKKLGVIPDLLCLSKGLTGGFLPLALTIASEEIYNNFLSPEKKNMFFHGHSFTGNPISCAAAGANIQTLKQKDWKADWKRIETFHKKKLKKFKNHRNILDTRACGTIAALEVKLKKQGYDSPFAEEFTAKAIKNGLFLRPLGNIIYILPPYCISNSELEQIWSFIEEELSY